MKRMMSGLFLLFAGIQLCFSQEQKIKPSNQEQEIINLSKEKWQWMADKKVDTLDALFHANAVFVHMGGS